FTAYSVNADTFESIAVLLRAGAVKKPMMQQPMNQFGGAMPQMGGMNPFGAGGMANPFQQVSPQQMPVQQPMPQGFMQQPQGGTFTKPAVFQRPQQQPQQNQRRNEQQNRSLPLVEKEQRPQEGQVNTGENFDDLKPRIFSDDEGII
ncbi:hypothetical protein KBD81_02800, partial [Candidatus Woesebacteria bacterium]|nr:hypothetical protein [Candidatus Woesebacteria bacterium]